MNCRSDVDAWIKQYGVRYFSELTNMACLMEEVGELARVMARTTATSRSRPVRKPTLPTKWLTSCGIGLSGQPDGVDLTAAVEANFAKKTSRDKEDGICTIQNSTTKEGLWGVGKKPRQNRR